MFLQQLANGIIIGSGYALIAIGLTMAFGIMRFSNFAHGTIYMLGGYCVYFFCIYLRLPYFLSVGLSMITIGVFGIILELVVFKPVIGKGHLLDVLMSLGLLIFLENSALLLFGAKTLGVNVSYNNIIISFFSISVTAQRLIVFILSCIIIGVLHLFLNLTKTGKSIVAVSQNPRGAAFVGIELSRVYALTFAISSALAAGGGALLAPIFYVYPTMGSMPLIKAFVVVVLGGMGNIQGAIVGGFIVGLVESLGGAYISSDYKNAFPFIIFIVVLLTMSKGIFGRSTD